MASWANSILFHSSRAIASSPKMTPDGAEGSRDSGKSSRSVAELEREEGVQQACAPKVCWSGLTKPVVRWRSG